MPNPRQRKISHAKENIANAINQQSHTDSSAIKKIIIAIGIILLVILGSFVAIIITRANFMRRENKFNEAESDLLFVGSRAHKNTTSYAKLAKLPEFGAKALTEIVTDKNLPISYKTNLVRLSRKFKKQDVVADEVRQNREYRLENLRAQVRKQAVCYDKKLNKRFANKLKVVTAGDKNVAKALEDNIRMGIDSLSLSHIAKLNQGARCNELLAIAALYILDFMEREKCCLNLAQRSIRVNGVDHGYLLITSEYFNLSKPFSKFTEKERNNSFVFDPYRDIFASVKEILNSPDSYTHFIGHDYIDDEVPVFFTCVFSDRVKDIDSQREYVAELKKIVQEFRLAKNQLKIALPVEYVCDDGEVYLKEISSYKMR